MSTVRVGDASFEARSATLELFHLFSKRPDWVLDVQLAGTVPRLWLAGTGEPAPYTRERRIDIAYMDAPLRLPLEDVDGAVRLVASGSLVAVELGAGRARVGGRFDVEWSAPGQTPRTLAIEVDVVAAIVT